MLQNIPIKLEALLTVTIDDEQTVEQNKIIETIGLAMVEALRSIGFVASVQACMVKERQFDERSPLDQ